MATAVFIEILTWGKGTSFVTVNNADTETGIVESVLPNRQVRPYVRRQEQERNVITVIDRR